MRLYCLLLGIWKALVIEHITQILCVKITSNWLFWWQKWQNVEIFMLIRSIIPNINSCKPSSRFFTYGKTQTKLVRHVGTDVNNVKFDWH